MSKKKPNPYDINRIFEQMTLGLIESLRWTSLKHKANELEESFRWEQCQSAKLMAMAEYRKRNRSIVSKFFRKADSVVDDVLLDSYKEGEHRFTFVWRRMLRIALKSFRIYEAIKLKRATIIGKVEMPVDFTPRNFKVPHHMLPKAPMETDFFRMNEKKLVALQESVKSDLKKAEHGFIRKMDDVYKQLIYRAEVDLTAGAKTLNQAIDMATKEFLEKGINIIEYSDGRRVTISAYVEMALRAASQRATFLGEGKKRDEWGVYTVLLSAHDNCSPMCLPYRGTVMIDDVYTSITKEDTAKLSKETGHELISEAMKNYAFHPNCRHMLATFFPGISSVPQVTEDSKAVERYEAEQKQRYMERQIRKYKRLHAGSVGEVNELRYRKKVAEWQNRLEEHLNKMIFFIVIG